MHYGKPNNKDWDLVFEFSKKSYGNHLRAHGNDSIDICKGIEKATTTGF